MWEAVLYLGFSFTDDYINDLRRSTVAMLGGFGQESSDPVAYAICNNKTRMEQVLHRMPDGPITSSSSLHRLPLTVPAGLFQGLRGRADSQLPGGR